MNEKIIYNTDIQNQNEKWIVLKIENYSNEKKDVAIFDNSPEHFLNSVLIKSKDADDIYQYILKSLAVQKIHVEHIFIQFDENVSKQPFDLFVGTKNIFQSNFSQKHTFDKYTELGNGKYKISIDCDIWIDFFTYLKFALNGLEKVDLFLKIDKQEFYS